MELLKQEAELVHIPYLFMGRIAEIVKLKGEGDNKLQLLQFQLKTAIIIFSLFESGLRYTLHPYEMAPLLVNRTLLFQRVPALSLFRRSCRRADLHCAEGN